jgi:RNA polymerase sigma-70 factor, ECF subfamily
MASDRARAPAAELARRLLAGRPGDLETVAPALAVALDGVERAHPDWPVPAEDLVDALAERLPAGAPGQALSRVRTALGRLGASASDIDDAVQKLRAHALVAEGGQAPRIARYGGLGPLPAWLSVVAARLFLREARRRSPAPGPGAPLPDDALDRLMESPELEAYRKEGRPAVKAAFQRAVASLQERHRTLLRLSVLDGLNGEQIGSLYGVNRSSVARWLQQCRTELGDAMRRELGEAGLDSLIGDLVSQLDLSLDRVLAQRETGETGEALTPGRSEGR